MSEQSLDDCSLVKHHKVALQIKKISNICNEVVSTIMALLYACNLFWQTPYKYHVGVLSVNRVIC